MANADGGRYQVQGGAPQFPAYASTATGFQYYVPSSPQPRSHPVPERVGMGGNVQQSNSHQQSTLVARNPPPPPPQGENLKNSNANSFGSDTSFSAAISLTSLHGGYFPPLRPPPLPPMFPWMSPSLAESMISSQFGEQFIQEASNLPFVPTIVNDADIAKMIENVIKEAEQVKIHQLQYYKDVINQDLPRPLKDMFQPLCCKLCTLTFSSPVVTKDHYSGKRHKKAVEAWVMKNPLLCTAKQKREAATGGGGQGKPSSAQPASGTFVKTPSGGIGLTGPINDYIMKQTPNQNQVAGALQPKPTHSTPPLPSLLGINFDNSRKRLAPSPPVIGTGATVGAPVVNTRQQQTSNQNELDSHSNGTQQKINQFTPSMPPQQLSPHAQTKPTVPVATGIKASNPSAPVLQNLNQGQGITWKMPESSTKSDSDFQAKRPRRDDFETAWKNVQPGPPQQPRERGSGHGDGPPPQKMCEICNVQLSSKVMARQHFNGKRHISNVANMEKMFFSVITDVTSKSTVKELFEKNMRGNNSSFGVMEDDNPFQQNQQFQNARYGEIMGGIAGMGGGNNGPQGRWGANNGPFGRGGGNNRPGGGRRGGCSMDLEAKGGNADGGFDGMDGGNPNINRCGGGGRGGRGGPVNGNSNSNNNIINNNMYNNNFNDKNRININNSSRGRK